MAGHIVEHGGLVLVPPFDDHAPSYAQASDYPDTGDLFLIEPDQLDTIERRRIEVKELTYDFTSHANWPHGNRFFVCKTRVWDEAKMRPFVFCYLNPAWTVFARLLASTSSAWWREEIKDGRTEIVQETFVTTLDNVKFFPLAKGV